jgi:hypothetical protein
LVSGPREICTFPAGFLSRQLKSATGNVAANHASQTPQSF